MLCRLCSVCLNLSVTVCLPPGWSLYLFVIRFCAEVKACRLAEQTNPKVQHPLLDKVRQCSADPDQAAAFFFKILSPTPSIRAQASHPLWCVNTINRMFAETGTGYDTAAAAKADLQSSQQRKPATCSAFCACFVNASHRADKMMTLRCLHGSRGQRLMVLIAAASSKMLLHHLSDHTQRPLPRQKMSQKGVQPFHSGNKFLCTSCKLA